MNCLPNLIRIVSCLYHRSTIKSETLVALGKCCHSSKDDVADKPQTLKIGRDKKHQGNEYWDKPDPNISKPVLIRNFISAVSVHDFSRCEGNVMGSRSPRGEP